jgi:GT2 family glycosyltransferase
MATKTFVARPMNTVSEFNSQVDIIIPYYGQYDRVMQLLESIFRLTRSNYYNLYVIDDCSPNEQYIKTIDRNAKKNAERLSQRNVLTTHRNETQRGFAGACKAGYDLGESPYVCFVNSDCLIKDSGWLRTMGQSLLNLKAQGVRMVSPMTDNPVGGDPAQKGEPFVRDGDDVVLGEDSHLSLYCFMCHRQLFNAVEGFLKEYPYGGYEDQEFAHRMKHYGYKQAVCRSSWVHHEGEVTMKSVMRNNPEVVATVEQNRNLAIADMRLLK